MAHEMTAEDFFRSLNGFDEIAIAKAFGTDIYVLRDKPLTFLRALVFVDYRRQQHKDGEAVTFAMERTVGDLEEYFSEEEQELDPGDPETDQGKEDLPSA